MLSINKSVGYSEEHNIFGAIVGVDFIKGTVTLMEDNGETHVVDINDVEELKEIGVMNGVYVYERDVLEHVNGNLYEVELTDFDKVVVHLLDSKLNRVKTGSAINKENFEAMGKHAKVVDSIFVLRKNLPTVDFNIRIVRVNNKDGVQYFYVGNNKENETVDVIKVVYAGQHLLEEEEYHRFTISHEEYLALVKQGVYKEVQPMELANYILGLTNGKISAKNNDVTNLDADDDLDDICETPCEDCDCELSESVEEEEEEYCDECQELEEDCDCELWEK
jgi:hypothetical protein